MTELKEFQKQIYNWKKGMKKIVVLFAAMILLSGCAFTLNEFDLNEGEISVTQNGRSARIGNTVLYDCTESYGTYIKSENSDTSKKLDDVTQNFAIDKISSSNQYFYLTGRETSDMWGGKANVLVMDINGKIIAAKNCCCEWIYACGSVILGYYNGHVESEEFLAWSATRKEVTHYLGEDEFLNSEDDDIGKWKPITGERMSLEGKEWFRQEKDMEHSVSYYTDTVYCDAYYVLKWINYVNGKEVSGLDWDIEEKSKVYIKQIQELTGGEEKNFDVFSWQLRNKLFVIYCIYNQSGGFLQHFTKDIGRSVVLQYEPNTDSLHIENSYEGKELAYWDETRMIYRKGKELFVENIHTHEVRKAFESDTTIHIDLTEDIVTLWDIEDVRVKNSDIFILE